MDAKQNTFRPAPRRSFSDVLLQLLALTVLTLCLTSSQADASEPVGEVAGTVADTAGAATESVVAATPDPSEAPPTPAPIPAAATESPVPAAASAPVTRTVAATTSAVEQAGEGRPAAGVAHAVRETTSVGAAAVEASGGATHTPAVEETTQRVAATVNSVGSVAADTTRDVVQSPASTVRGDDDPDAAGHDHALSVGDRGHQASELPSLPDTSSLPGASPRLFDDPVAAPHGALAAPPVASRLATPRTANAGPASDPPLLAGADGPGATGESVAQSTAPPPSGDARAGAHPQSPPPLSPPTSAATASSPAGGGFGSFLLFLALLALLALAAPRTPPTLLQVGRRPRSAIFICALERPG
jgi:hypothetical protein